MTRNYNYTFKDRRKNQYPCTLTVKPATDIKIGDHENKNERYCIKKAFGV